MDHDHNNRLKQRKLDKHFNIVVNGKTVRILNYKINDVTNHLTNEPGQTIELITKITNGFSDHDKIECVISKENEEVRFTGTWYTTASQHGLKRYCYRVEKIDIIQTPTTVL